MLFFTCILTVIILQNACFLYKLCLHCKTSTIIEKAVILSLQFKLCMRLLSEKFVKLLIKRKFY